MMPPPAPDASSGVSDRGRSPTPSMGADLSATPTLLEDGVSAGAAAGGDAAAASFSGPARLGGHPPRSRGGRGASRIPNPPFISTLARTPEANGVSVRARALAFGASVSVSSLRAPSRAVSAAVQARPQTARRSWK